MLLAILTLVPKFYQHEHSLSIHLLSDCLYSMPYRAYCVLQRISTLILIHFGQMSLCSNFLNRCSSSISCCTNSVLALCCILFVILSQISMNAKVSPILFSPPGRLTASTIASILLLANVSLHALSTTSANRIGAMKISSVNG